MDRLYSRLLRPTYHVLPVWFHRRLRVFGSSTSCNLFTRLASSAPTPGSYMVHVQAERSHRRAVWSSWVLVSPHASRKLRACSKHSLEQRRCASNRPAAWSSWVLVSPYPARKLRACLLQTANHR